ncbi:MAG: rod-binding protein [Brevinematales bacterium]|nr:rod-binding protein [Brevinematales bacterium]
MVGVLNKPIENNNFDINKLRNIDTKKLDKKQILSVSREFESLFINQLFKSMRKTIQKSDWLNGGLKQEFFEDMLYEEYSKKIAHSGGIGLGDMVYKFLISNQNNIKSEL